MRNDKFWDECNGGSIRQKVAEFIDKSPTLSGFKGKKYYDLENELVEFIEENKDIISAEVDREYQRDDLKSRVIKQVGKDAQKILDILSIETIDAIVECWQECLMDDDSGYWDMYWETLDDTLSDGGICPVFAGVENYEPHDVETYTAYLKDWYENHFSDNEDPACIDEFFDNEMLDDELLGYYIEKSKELFGENKEGKPTIESK